MAVVVNSKGRLYHGFGSLSMYLKGLRESKYLIFEASGSKKHVVLGNGALKPQKGTRTQPVGGEDCRSFLRTIRSPARALTATSTHKILTLIRTYPPTRTKYYGPRPQRALGLQTTWVVVQIMAPVWVLV